MLDIVILSCRHTMYSTAPHHIRNTASILLLPYAVSLVSAVHHTTEAYSDVVVVCQLLSKQVSFKMVPSSIS